MPDWDDEGSPWMTGVLSRPGHLVQQEPLSRTELRRQQQRARRRRRRGGFRSVVLFVALLLVVGGGYGAYRVLAPVFGQLTEEDDFTGGGTGQVSITIPEGASGRAIGRVLADAGVVKSGKAFADEAARNPKAASIQPGEYVLRQRMSAASALAMLLSPDSRQIDRITIREGLRAKEIIALLAKETGTDEADYATALKVPEDLGLPSVAKGKVEGWLFPATYDFAPSSSARDQLAEMITRTRQELDELGVPTSRAQRVLTIASIAEVEVNRGADYAKVARVIENRLDGKLSNGGRLQMDSTVSYALGKKTLTTTAKDRAFDSRYNTYRYPGLPPGPVSNPGRAAVEGALQPARGRWVYFVTVNPSTGETRFAVTDAEHQRNVATFRTWCRANPGQC
ncbi:MAG: endolytic transglycosylase MltG [Angustibacter sp.]